MRKVQNSPARIKKRTFILKSIINVHLMPLTKLWLVNLLGFVGLDGFGWYFFHRNAIYFLAFLFSVNFLALIGLSFGKHWGRRMLMYILLSMCAIGIFWPTTSYQATQAMQTYMQRSFNAWNYNHYWLPMIEKYCGVSPFYA